MNDKLIQELYRIKKKYKRKGVHPEDVLKEAKRPTSPLHGEFEWNDAKAAHQHRLEQARHLIAVAVVYEPKLGGPVRAFVSLSSERGAGAGYRSMEQVLGSGDLRDIIVRDAISWLDSGRARFGMLDELAAVWAAVDAVKSGRNLEAAKKTARKAS